MYFILKRKEYKYIFAYVKFGRRIFYGQRETDFRTTK